MTCLMIADEVMDAPGREDAEALNAPLDATLDFATWARQRELEDVGMAEGAVRFRRKLSSAQERGSALATRATRKLLLSGLVGLEQAINAMLSEAKGRRGIKFTAAKWIQGSGGKHRSHPTLGVRVVAYMTLKAVLDATLGGQPAPVGKLALTLADTMMDELRYRRFKKEAPQLFEWKLQSFTTSNVAHKARSLKASLRFAEVDTSDLDDLPRSKKLLIGTKLIDLLLTSQPDWFDAGHLSPADMSDNVKTVIVLAESVRSKLALDHDLLAFMQPVVGPMVVPPLRWAPGHRGGYRFALRGKFPMVRNVSRAQARKINEADMPVVYEALNTIQNTAWRVNTRVLDVVKEIIDLGGGFAGLPKSEDVPLPPQPVPGCSIEDIETNEAARKAWRKAAHAVHNQNHARSIESANVARVLAAAESVKDDAAIYFPHSLDFRGRVYPIASYLTPQGDDLSRSLLMFAEGKPLDDTGARWLAIHGANLYGETPDGRKVSAMTLDERVAFVQDNEKLILKSADDPLSTAWWTSAESPLQFLAFCFEWTNYIRAAARGESYVCALPVHMDASASGLQHFSALLRDEAGGRATNLVPQATPQDIYSKVAKAVLDRLEAEAATDHLSKLWLESGLVDRKLCKRPVMTWPYGSRLYGFKTQLKDYLRGRDDYHEIEAHFTFEHEGSLKPQVGLACVKMAKLIADSLRTVVVSAHDAMSWLQAATQGIAAQNRCVEWITPGGFPVKQEYYDTREQSVTTTLAGRVVYPTFSKATASVDKLKQRNGSSPNTVHSLDACHLMMTATAAADAGVQMSAVHDSFVAVPSDCNRLGHILRSTFIEMYSRDIAADLYSQLAAQWADPAKCPEPPSKGDLDVSRLLHSDYFFS